MKTITSALAGVYCAVILASTIQAEERMDATHVEQIDAAVKAKSVSA